MKNRVVYWLSLVGVIALLITAYFPVSASAATDEPSSTYNLLDYTSIDSVDDGSISGKNSVSVHDYCCVYFTLPFSLPINYVDFIVSISVQGDDALSLWAGVNNTSLNWKPLTNFNDDVTDGSVQFFRVYGVLNSAVYSELNVEFSFDESYFRVITFERFNVSPYVSRTSDWYTSLAVYYDGVDYTGSYPSNPRVEWNAASDYSFSFFLTSNASNHDQFDYLDVSFLIKCNSISSIGVISGNGQDPPFTISWLQSENVTVYNCYYVNIHIDLRDFEPGTSLELYLQGLADFNEINFVRVFECVGGNYLDIEDPYVYWLRQIQATMKDFVGGNSQAADHIDRDSESISSGIHFYQDSFDSLDRPDFSGDNFSGIQSLIDANYATNTVFLTSFLNTRYIKEVVVFAAIMAVFSFILFGKK